MIFSSYLVFMLEKDFGKKEGPDVPDIKSYADALWWGVVCIRTVLYIRRLELNTLHIFMQHSCSSTDVQYSHKFLTYLRLKYL